MLVAILGVAVAVLVYSHLRMQAELAKTRAALAEMANAVAGKTPSALPDFAEAGRRMHLLGLIGGEMGERWTNNPTWPASFARYLVEKNNPPEGTFFPERPSTQTRVQR